MKTKKQIEKRLKDLQNSLPEIKDLTAQIALLSRIDELKYILGVLD